MERKDQKAVDRDLAPGVCALQVLSAPFVQCCRGGLWEGCKPSWWMVSRQASACAHLLTHWFLHSPQICGCCAPLVFWTHGHSSPGMHRWPLFTDALLCLLHSPWTVNGCPLCSWFSPTLVPFDGDVSPGPELLTSSSECGILCSDFQRECMS